MMSLNWRGLEDETPYDGQTCLVNTKHGIHQGDWDSSEKVFRTYLFGDIEFYGIRWIPIGEAE